MCSANRDLMAKKCPKMCNLCGKLTFDDGIKVQKESWLKGLQLQDLLKRLFFPHPYRVPFEMSKWRSTKSSELCLLMYIWLEGYGLFR